MNRLVFAGPKPGIGCHTGMVNCTAADKSQGLQVFPRQILVKVGDRATPIRSRYGEGVHCIQVPMPKAIHLVNNAILSESSKGKRHRPTSMPSNMTKCAANQEGEK